MAKHVHIVPVGFDRDRLVVPIAKGGVDVDLVYVLRGTGDDSEDRNKAFSEEILERVYRDLEVATKLDPSQVQMKDIGDVHDYESAYVAAYELFAAELKQENYVYVNISSMPRTVSFAFAAAANDLVLDKEEWRQHLIVYYTAPEEYLVTRVLDELSGHLTQLNHYFHAGLGAHEAQALLADLRDSIRRTVTDLREYGMTKGAKPIKGQYMYRLPLATTKPLREFEDELLQIIASSQEIPSVTHLAELVADRKGINRSELLKVKSRVIYNANTLAQKGFIRSTEEGRRNKIVLSPLGRLWLETKRVRESIPA